MGYPTSVNTFTNKNAGDVIQPAHVNDLQTEVTAIESDLINGFTGKLTANAGFQSSNSTCASLNVTGASTIANLTVTSSFAAPIPTVLVTSSQVTQIAADGNWVGLNWESESYDLDSMHSTSVNSSRITFAASSGVYQVGLHVEWGGSTGMRGARILQSDATVIAQTLAYDSVDGLTVVNQAVSGLVYATDTTAYVTAQVRIPSGGGSTGRLALVSASEHRFWAHRVRK